MDAILRITTEKVLPAVQKWDSVDAVVVLRFGTDRYDPSFFISYDVYYTGDIPDASKREGVFDFAAGFESTFDGQKDRILVDDVPVRLEYKPSEIVTADVERARDPHEGDSLLNTYGFYRLVNGEAILERSDWLSRTRELLTALPDEFWTRRTAVLRSRMDHVLADLSSAVFAEEELFYYLSLAAFLSTLSALLFSINHRFEPAGRILNDQLQKLPVLPDEFGTRLQYLLRSDTAVTGKRKREVAELITWSVLRLT
jgi:hypothetical protein